MAWARIDDRAMSHPKVIGLTDKAFRLWIWGLCYAQAHLTNGFLLAAAVPIGYLKGSAALLECGLWEVAEKGFRIHDYVDWNDPKEKVKERQMMARERKERWLRTRSERVPNASHERVRNDVPTQPNPTQPVLRSKEQNVVRDGRSKRPIFSGQRLTVFEWMLDDCCRVLGNHLDTFDLHEWFFALDAMAVSDGLVIPKRDGGEWLQAQLLAEARRRGIPLRLATAETPKDYEADTRAQADAALALLHKRHA